MKKLLTLFLIILMAISLASCDRRKPLSKKEISELHSYSMDAIAVLENWEDNFYFGLSEKEKLIVMNGEIYISKTATTDYVELLEAKNDFKDTIMELLKETEVESFSGWRAVGIFDFIHYSLTDEQRVNIFGDDVNAPDVVFLNINFYDKNKMGVAMDYPYDEKTQYVLFDFFVDFENLNVQLEDFKKVI